MSCVASSKDFSRIVLGDVVTTSILSAGTAERDPGHVAPVAAPWRHPPRKMRRIAPTFPLEIAGFSEFSPKPPDLRQEPRWWIDRVEAVQGRQAVRRSRPADDRAPTPRKHVCPFSSPSTRTRNLTEAGPAAARAPDSGSPEFKTWAQDESRGEMIKTGIWEAPRARPTRSRAPPSSSATSSPASSRSRRRAARPGPTGPATAS